MRLALGLINSNNTYTAAQIRFVLPVENDDCEIFNTIGKAPPIQCYLSANQCLLGMCAQSRQSDV